MIGLIPAAGSAERWGGYIKELLPIDSNTKLIDRTINILQRMGCTTLLVITNKQKIDTIVKHLDVFCQIRNIPVSYIIGGATMWKSIEKSLPFLVNDSTIMAMPDTYFTPEAECPIELESDFSLGLFNTYYPDQFSVLINGNIYTKDSSFINAENHSKKYEAWGLAGWSQQVSKFWLEHPLGFDNGDGYDRMFEKAINNFSLSTFKLKEYWDMKNFSAYKEFLCQKK